MKLSWLTDIHLNFLNVDERKTFYQEIIQTQCDGVLISGDIAEAHNVIELLTEMSNNIEKPIYFVLGNHDYYRGEVGEVRDEMTQLTYTNKLLFWLPAIEPFSLNSDTFLVGQDGWADGRFGDYAHSTYELNDSVYIEDLYQAKIAGKAKLLNTMQQLADHDANCLKRQLMQAIQQKPKKIIVITHIPPFEEVCAPRGDKQNIDLVPYYSSKATGDVLLNVSKDHTDIEFLVLCGHTHSKASSQLTKNLMVKVGNAQYGEPAVQKIIQL